MLARGQIALENLTHANAAWQKRDIMENQAKVETLNTLEINSQVNQQRANHQKMLKE